MAKILLVEDDNNLREIFEMRLKAEGYDTLTAGDGEQALVVALKNKPDLIIADVMMPRLSGFEMIETLRSAPNMADVKVIMMTALGQAEDRARGEKLGVVKYLVKSQVTLEDFVRVVREVLQPDQTAKDSAKVSQSTNKQESEGVMQDDSSGANQPMSNPPAGGSTDSPTPNVNPISDTPAMGGSDSGSQMTSEQQQNAMQDQIKSFVGSSPSTPTSSDSGSTGTPTMSNSDGMPPDSNTPSPGSDTDAPDIPVTPAPTPDQGTGPTATPPTPGGPSAPGGSQQ